jgi:hypothetical protein
VAVTLLMYAGRKHCGRKVRPHAATEIV